MSARYDVVIIGAGPSGSTCAAALARKGHSVLLVDRRKVPGTPVQCAETVSKAGLKENEIGIDGEWLVNEVQGITLHSPDGSPFYTKEPMYNIKRDVFDRHLVDLAIAAGSELLPGARFEGCERDRGLWAMSLIGKRVECRMLIGADGPSSVVGSRLGLLHNIFNIKSIQYKCKGHELKGSHGRWNHIYFSNRYRSGYAWAFPRGDEVNVGIVSEDPNFKQLADFCETLGLNTLGAEKTAGLIPFKRTPECLHHPGGGLLVGDAAGLTHPITYGGIYPALTSGRIAAKFVSDALNKKDNRLLSGYDRAMRKKLGLNHSQNGARAFFSLTDSELNFVARFMNGKDVREVGPREALIFLKSPGYYRLFPKMISIRRAINVK